MAKRSRVTKILFAIVLLVIAGAVLFFMGPRTPVSTDISFNPSVIGEDVDSYLSTSEAGFGDIRSGLGKQIVWAYPNSRARTPLSIVYVHGFSASPGEIRPVMDIVAKNLGANLFYTRLQGHGRSGEAMGEASVEGWINDIAEAIAVGERIAERVVLVGTSTGGTLATWTAAQPELTKNLAGIVLISPNYGQQAAGSQLLTYPWARQLVRLVEGKNRSFEPKNDLHRQYWTTVYPSVAVLPMAELVKLANNIDIEKIAVPSLFILSERDKVVRPDLTKNIAQRWGADSEIVLIEDDEDENHHVIAGDALSPSTTQQTADIITDWINRLPGSS